MPSTSPTKPGQRKLSEVAKFLVEADGIVATGYPSVEAQCRRMGVVHDDWQRGLARLVLAKRANGLYAAGVGGVTLSTCRQVGKTFTFGSIVFALCILTEGTKVLWTAHHTKTSDETFESLKSMATRARIAPYVQQVRLGNGQQAIVFKNGSRILFGAREHGFGRGIPGVSIVVFDEAQILKQSALNDMVPAANTVRNPLILYFGTPPDPKDPSEVIKNRRKRALAVAKRRVDGETAKFDGAYVEIGADDDADVDDREQWRKGNPSYPQRTTEEAMQRLRENLTDDAAFRREGLGIWDRETEAATRLVKEKAWKATAVDRITADGVRSFGIAFSQDGLRQSVAGALRHDAGVHLELVGTYTGPTDEGVVPLADWLAARWRDTAMIAISGAAGAEPLRRALVERKVPEAFIHTLTTPEYNAAGPLLLEAVKARTMTHPVAGPDDPLEASVAVTDKKLRGRSGWSLVPTTPDGDETPMEAIAIAHWAAKTTKRVPSANGRGRRSRGR